MAVHGPLIDIYPVPFTAIESLQGEPDGPLSPSPYELTSRDPAISAVESNRFPVPPTAGGFLVDPSIWNFPDFPVLESPRLGATKILFSSLLPENTHLEPTLGQIWPRIG